MWKNTARGIEFPRIFCAGIGSPQLGVVLVSLNVDRFEGKKMKIVSQTHFLKIMIRYERKCFRENIE